MIANSYNWQMQTATSNNCKQPQSKDCKQQQSTTANNHNQTTDDSHNQPPQQPQSTTAKA